MDDPHPLAIIPLQKDPLLLSDTSSSSSTASSPNNRSCNQSGLDSFSCQSLVPVRALVPHAGSSLSKSTSPTDWRDDDSVRSEDDTALMRSLISLMPHEQADSQFSVTSPGRPSRTSANKPWFKGARSSHAFGGNADEGSRASNTTGGSNGALHGVGDSRGGGGGVEAASRGQGRGGVKNRGSSSQTTRFPRDDGIGLKDAGFDFLGTTDSVRDLLHLPYTSDAVTVGLHRVGQTLVLDGNLDEVLTPTATAKAPVPAPPPNSRERHGGGGDRGVGSSARAPGQSQSSPPSTRGGGLSDVGGSCDNGGCQTEGRWVMVGRGGKPQRDGAEDAWGEERESHDADTAHSSVSKRMAGPRSGSTSGRTTTRSGAKSSPDMGAMKERKDSRGWEIASSGQRDSGRQDVEAGNRAGAWSLMDRGGWPTVGASASADDDTGPSSDGILSIVPSQPRGSSYGTPPPEPAGFWRAFQWELAGMRLMLGSNLQVCSTSEHPQVSVRLHDVDEDLSLCTCLDYYLDNVMENVPELAICMREKGYIQGCRLVSTEDIPYLGSLSGKTTTHDPRAATVTAPSSGPSQEAACGGVAQPVPLFDPVVVELNATILLRFLQENCSREGGTYLLHRSEGAAHVQLYDVSALSRQRHRRWKWLLAMLCYRFALRISHHTRQPWCGGGRPSGAATRAGPSSSVDGTADVGTLPGPKVVQQLQRRQRQLLENSLELLEELEQLGGGGHETICASVQEHIADMYLGYSGVHGALSGGDTDSSDARDGAVNGESDGFRQRDRGVTKAEGAAAGEAGMARHKGQARAPWTVGPGGEVWTSALPPRGARKTLHAAPGARKKGKRRGGPKNGPTQEREANPKGGDERGGAHPGSVRLGGTGTGAGGGAGGVGIRTSAERTGGSNTARKAEQETEENLDKAQAHLTSGIAILRGVMARQESAAAGKDDSAADLVIVGERRLPVAVMRQQSPWLAVDDDDDDDDEGNKFGDVAADGTSGDGSGTGAAAFSGGIQRRRRRRRGSRDESEDPATAMGVVSEQLWGLQQKLVGTYVAVARARLGQAFPDPPLTAVTATPASAGGASAGREKRARSGKSSGGSSSGGKGNAWDKRAATGRGSPNEVGRGEDIDECLDQEARVELVRGAVDSLCAAWDHLEEATVTLNRRAATMCPRQILGHDDGGDALGSGHRCDAVGNARDHVDPSRGASDFNGTHIGERSEGSHSQLEGRQEEDQGCEQQRQGSPRQDMDRAERLGPLWKGSLSEALVHAGEAGTSHSRHVANAANCDGTIAAYHDSIGVDDSHYTTGSGGANDRGSSGNDSTILADQADEAMGSSAWDHSARCQLEARRSELIELCGDVAHACVSLRPAGGSTNSSAGPAGSDGGDLHAFQGLPARLQELLSSARPPILLSDLDVCKSLHGRILEALNSNAQHQGSRVEKRHGSRNKGRNSQSRTQAGLGRGSHFKEAKASISDRGESLAAAATQTRLNRGSTQDDNFVKASSGGSLQGLKIPAPDPSPLAETCIHSLARAGHIPADATSWSLCLAAEACYARALVDLARSSVSQLHPSVAAASVVSPRGKWLDREGMSPEGAAEARARLRKKLGDACNELGKLMAQCAGALVQAPSAPLVSACTEVEAVASAATDSARTAKGMASAKPREPSPSLPPPHPAFACAVCVACAQMWFRASMAEFTSIGDARNTALLMCNLASVERLTPRALARLKEALPTLDLTATLAEPVSKSSSHSGGGRSGGGKSSDPSRSRGAAVAVELCGQAHEALGSRDADARTWDHVSRELAMAYLCLGVERRQALLTRQLPANATLGGSNSKTQGIKSDLPGEEVPTVMVTPTPPSVAQAREVIDPLERALQIYTEMHNAQQAAACHYQIGQYFAKVLPTYVASGGSPNAGSTSPPRAGDGGSVRSIKSSNGSTAPPSPSPSSHNHGAGSTTATFQGLKAWEIGQGAARHFLAARAYFATFEHGPTTVILALDLCNLYTFLANIGAPASSTSAAGGDINRRITDGAAGESAGPTDDVSDAPAKTAGGRERAGRESHVSGGQLAGGNRARPAAIVRCQCLEGALRSLLDTRSVFADAGVDTVVRVSGASVDNTAEERAGPHGRKLQGLLRSVMECLPKVLQALVRVSTLLQTAAPPSTAVLPPPVPLPSAIRASMGTAAASSGQGMQSTRRSNSVISESGLTVSSTFTEGGSSRGSAVSPAKDREGQDHDPFNGDINSAKTKATIFKSMYRRSLMGMMNGGEGALATLAGLAADYGTVADGDSNDDAECPMYGC